MTSWHSRSDEWSSAWAKFVADNPAMFPPMVIFDEVTRFTEVEYDAVVEYVRTHPMPDLSAVTETETDAILKLVDWAKP